MNPAAVPTPLEDVQGDGRWLSMVRHDRAEGRDTTGGKSASHYGDAGVLCSR